MRISDIDRGFFDTLSNLSPDLDRNTKKAIELLHEKRKNPLNKTFAAISKDGKVLGLATIFIDKKFTHNFCRRGYLEDVVVRKGYEGKGIGSALVRAATKFADKKKCQRVVLSCENKHVVFYERLGYKKESNFMITYLRNALHFNPRLHF